MLAGRRVEIAVMGGSVSAGAIASRKMAAVDPNDVWSLVRLELQVCACVWPSVCMCVAQ